MLGGGDGFLQRAGETDDLILLDRERGQRLDHVHAMARHLAEDPVIAEQRHGDQLREEARLAALDRLPQRAPAPSGRGPEFDRPHQPQAANLADHLISLCQRCGQLEQQPPDALGPGDELL